MLKLEILHFSIPHLLIEHNAVVNKFSIIGLNSTIAGGVCLGAYSAIGIGSNVFEKVCIGENTLIGGDSVVNKDTADNVVAYGNLCKIIRERTARERYLK